MTRDPLRLARDLAAFIGVVTAVVGFVKLVLDGWASILDVLPWAGVAYLVLIEALVLWVLFQPRHVFQAGMVWSTRIAAGLVAGAIPFTIISLLQSSDEHFLTVVGVLGLIAGLLIAVFYSPVRNRMPQGLPLPS
jgi:hypothetical protein